MILSDLLLLDKCLDDYYLSEKYFRRVADEEIEIGRNALKREIRIKRLEEQLNKELGRDKI
jgi:methylphosphotriester-DNA--protein-cysteine methyltransferase